MIGIEEPVAVATPCPTVPTRRAVEGIRRAVEISVSLLGIGAFALVLPAVAIAIRLESPGPVFFCQTRAGRGMKPFRVFKLRTMVSGAEARRDDHAHLNVMGGATFKVRGDVRITRVGRWLRRLSLDEAPQFVNILRGDMALVGPRPLPMVEALALDERERARFSVRPGLTGLWQVSGRNLLGHDRMIECDLEYLARRRLWFDLVIILRTVPATIRCHGAF